MSDHISEDLAMILPALSEDDRERRAAFAHAERCSRCTRLLERSADVLDLLDAHDVELQLDPRLKTRVLDSIQKLEQRSTRAPWERYALAARAMLSFFVALLDVRMRAGLFPARAPLCVMWVMLGASLSLTVVGIGARDWARGSSPLRLAVVATGGALLSQLWLRVRCPTHDAPLHVLTFHLSGVLLAGLLGYLLARALWHSDG